MPGLLSCLLITLTADVVSARAGRRLARAQPAAEWADARPSMRAAAGGSSGLSSYLAGEAAVGGTIDATWTPPPQPALPGGGCVPKCTWKCEMPMCDQICEPSCEAPRCETRCGAADTSSCKIKCEQPVCTVLCPKRLCAGRECAECHTECKEPLCDLTCPGMQPCHNVCEHPKCDWICKEPKLCPRPQCRMVCDAPRDCTKTTYHQKIPPKGPNEVTIQSFRAPPAAAPDPAEDVVRAPTPEPEQPPAPPAQGAWPMGTVVQIGGTISLPPGPGSPQVVKVPAGNTSMNVLGVPVGGSGAPPLVEGEWTGVVVPSGQAPAAKPAPEAMTGDPAADLADIEVPTAAEMEAAGAKSKSPSFLAAKR